MEEVTTIKPIDKIAVTMKEAAELLSVSVPTVYKTSKMEGFPVFNSGRTLVSRSGLEAWVEKQVAKENGTGG